MTDSSGRWWEADTIYSFTGPYRFLSNFYSADVEFEGIVYPTSEHAFQAAKSLDPMERAAISRAPSPRAAKYLGRCIKLRPHWDSVKVEIMRTILRSKFTRNEDLRAALVATGSVHLEEGNSWGDTFWGTVNGHGENWLGRLLMDLREELKND